MTAGDVRAAGRALDAEIAERVFGRTLVAVSRLKAGPFEAVIKCEGREIGEYGQYYLEDGSKIYLGKPFSFRHIPHYSTSIAAAWLVVEKLDRITDLTSFRHEGKLWYSFGFERPDGTRLSDDAEAETLPLVIARAALAAIRTSSGGS